MRNTFQNSLEWEKIVKSWLRPAIGKLITWISITAWLLIWDWINNKSSADVPELRLPFPSVQILVQKTPVDYAIDWLKSIKNLQRIVDKISIEKIESITLKLSSDLDRIQKSKRKVKIAKLEEIKTKLDSLSENIENKEMTQETLINLKEDYILLWNELNNFKKCLKILQ